MKIAVTCENGTVFQHFGHTPEFAIYDVEDGKMRKTSNPVATADMAPWRDCLRAKR